MYLVWCKQLGRPFWVILTMKTGKRSSREGAKSENKNGSGEIHIIVNGGKQTRRTVRNDEEKFGMSKVWTSVEVKRW